MSVSKVVKGLICCTNWKDIIDCCECPYHHPTELCGKKLIIDALAVIDELQANNEKLKKELAAAEDRVNELEEVTDENFRQNEFISMLWRTSEEQTRNANKALESERAYIENLKKEKDHLRALLAEEYKHAKDMALKEIVTTMQQKLKYAFCPEANYCGYDIHAAINEKAREMLEDEG